MNEFNQICLIANPEKTGSRKLLRKVAALIQAASKRAICDAATARFAGLSGPVCPDVPSLSRAVDL